MLLFMILIKNVYIEKYLILILEIVFDLEIFVFMVLDLGVICEVMEEDGIIKIKLIFIYFGCLVMDVIGDDLRKVFLEIGKNIEVELVFSFVWSIDWISEFGF